MEPQNIDHGELDEERIVYIEWVTCRCKKPSMEEMNQ
jgi:hypothetical protein